MNRGAPCNPNAPDEPAHSRKNCATAAECFLNSRVTTAFAGGRGEYSGAQAESRWINAPAHAFIMEKFQRRMP
jgi:hypothetical protein